jgi:ribonucleoside-diphosphate reductase beta chain
MSKKVFTTEKFDHTAEPMFFGRDVNTLRFDTMKYPQLDTWNRKQMGQFWIPEEISLENDKQEFIALPAAAKHVFESNLLYQGILDGANARGPSLTLLRACSIPELEAFIETWSFFEGSIHSRSYTHIIRNLYDDPTEILDKTIEIPELVERAEVVTATYDSFIEYMDLYDVLGYGTHEVNGETVEITEYELKKRLYLLINSIYILESLRFYVSFACSWAFAEGLQVLKKNAKIIKMIARDENLHMAVTNFILKRLMDGSEGEMFKQIAIDCADEVEEMMRAATEQECEWAKYLFKDGSIIGLNTEILIEYVTWLANRRWKALGHKTKLYPDAPTYNPLPWTESWIGGKSVQVAPQETEITAYKIGGINKSVDKDKFKNFQL